MVFRGLAGIEERVTMTTQNESAELRKRPVGEAREIALAIARRHLGIDPAQALREMRERAVRAAEKEADRHEADRKASHPDDATYHLWARQSANHIVSDIRALPLDPLDKGE
jgi:hypothetical protein